MNPCRQSQVAARSAQEHVDAYSKLADAWDDRVLRVGDTAQRSTDDEHHRRHNSSYIPKSVLRLAFTRVGKATDRDGLEGTQKSLSICTTVARAAQLAQQRASSAHLATTPFVLARSYGLTPLRIDFGSMRPMLAPSARYLVPSSVGVKRWRPVPLEEYLRFKGIHTHVLPQRGVVELMGQSACIGIYDPESKSFNEELHLLQPVFCARSNASTIFRAVEQSIPTLGAPGLCDMASRVPFGILCEVADSAASNRRKQRESFRQLPENVLGVAIPCGSHRVHSVVASSTKEKKLVGDVHAVSFAASLPSHREMLLKALWSLLSQPGFFRRYVGVPVNETPPRACSGDVEALPTPSCVHGAWAITPGQS